MLTLEELLIETDPDLTLAATIVIGFDDHGHLTLEYRISDCNNPLEKRIKYISVTKEEAYALAKKVHIALTELPNYIYKIYGIRPLCQAMPSEASSLFGEILDFYNQYGVNYQLTKRTVYDSNP